jgi:peptidoglycan-N-acetylglucosamine deacetylase
VYLTFDDGPHPEITRWVMQELQKYNYKATFFCVGENAQQHPEVIKALKTEGHSIGNHTQNHIKGWNTDSTIYLANTLAAASNTSNTLFRPPYGRITATQAKLLRQSGFKIIMWNLLSCDYLKDLNCTKALSALKNGTNPGSIVVFHDSEKAFENIKQLLPSYLQFLSRQGYTSEVL